LAADMQQILIIAALTDNETDRKKLADIAEKWLMKAKI
jgi:hypothetical protein